MHYGASVSKLFGALMLYIALPLSFTYNSLPPGLDQLQTHSSDNQAIKLPEESLSSAAFLK